MSTYSFRADHPNPKTTRLLHLLFYLGALLLLIAAIHSLYLYFTHWSSPDDNSGLWHLVLGIVYLLVSGLIAYATYNHGGAGSQDETPPDRYVEVSDGRLVYELSQLEGRQEVRLAEVERVERPSVRDLVLYLRGGEQVVLPIYLIDDEAKQEELERVLSR